MTSLLAHLNLCSLHLLNKTEIKFCKHYLANYNYNQPIIKRKSGSSLAVDLPYAAKLPYASNLQYAADLSYAAKCPYTANFPYVAKLSYAQTLPHATNLPYVKTCSMLQNCRMHNNSLALLNMDNICRLPLFVEL